MNTERLLRLAEHLMTVDVTKFELSYWKIEDSCGTAACAVGHACDIPEFKEAGLYLKLKHPRQRTYELKDYTPTYDEWDGFDAVDNFFNIGRDESAYLFSQHRYGYHKPTPIDVSNRIKEFVNK